MPNLMITDRCNLHCAYCFANEFVNKKASDMTTENFRKALDFAVNGDKCAHIGIIGGEPTLHRHFSDFLKILIFDNRVFSATIYTNGLAIDGFLDDLANEKFGILINCNSPLDIGDYNYKCICDNIDRIINERDMRERISLGINFYRNNQDYEYILKLLKKYDFHHVRISVSVPKSIGVCGEGSALSYFMMMKPLLMRFFSDALKNGIIPHYDCNKMPVCLINKPESDSILELIKPNSVRADIEKRSNISIFSDIVNCTPVVDILQDLTAIRCFGLSEYSKVNIEDFRNIVDLRNYYCNEFDVFAYQTTSNSDCVSCYRRRTQRCMGGCLIFKIDDILNLKAVCKKNMNENSYENLPVNGE